MQRMRINKGNWSGENATIDYSRLNANHIQFKTENLGSFIIKMEPDYDGYEDHEKYDVYNVWVREANGKDTVIAGFVHVIKDSKGAVPHNERTQVVAWDHPYMGIERQARSSNVNRVETVVEAVAQVIFNLL